MKNKLLLSALLCFCATQAYAAVGYGFREYGHSTQATPGSNGHIEEITHEEFLAHAKKKAHSLAISHSSTATSIPEKSGRVREYIQIDGYHSFRIYNDTKQRQTYRLAVSVTAAGKLNFSDSRYVDVEPGGTYTRDDKSVNVVQPENTGTYLIQGYTSISGPSSHSSQDSAVLKVSK